VPDDARRRGGHAAGSALRNWGLAVVSGRSMQPTLQAGDRLLVHYGVAPRPGRIAVVQLPGYHGWSVKRIGWADKDGWWIERDNPVDGVDSWQVGPVLPEAVVAVALLRIWPWPRLLTRLRPGRRGGRGTSAVPR
jgi:signal peptidase I